MGPYASVNEGKIEVDRRDEKRAFEPTDWGVLEAGRFLSEVPVEELGMTCSSSVDFPEDDGLPDFDVHEWLGRAMGRAVEIRLKEGKVTPGRLCELGHVTFEEAMEGGT